MIDLALDSSDTRPARAPAARGCTLRTVLFGLVGMGALGGFGVAASGMMAGLAAPPPVKRASPSRASDWPDLKDGLPAVAGSGPTPATAPKRAEPEAPALRIAALPEPITAIPSPAKNAPAAPGATAPAASAAGAPEPPTKRIPTPTPVAPLGPIRQAVPIAPARTAALQGPRAAETVRARDLVEPAATPAPMMSAPVTPAASAAPIEKPARKAAAARRAPIAPKADDTAKGTAAPAAVAQAEAPESDEAEVLGIKLPSLAPAGRKLKEGVNALGDAVKNVF